MRIEIYTTRTYHFVRFDAQVGYLSYRALTQILGPNRKRPSARQIRDNQGRGGSTLGPY